jgi:hypothetical protein
MCLFVGVCSNRVNRHLGVGSVYFDGERAGLFSNVAASRNAAAIPYLFEVDFDADLEASDTLDELADAAEAGVELAALEANDEPAVELAALEANDEPAVELAPDCDASADCWLDLADDMFEVLETGVLPAIATDETT